MAFPIIIIIVELD